MYDPVALPRRGVKVLEPTVKKTDELGLVPVFKKKNLWFSIFSFDFYTDTIVKQWNMKYYFFHFSFFSLVFCFLFLLCFPIVVPCVWSRCTTPSWGRSPWANRWKTDELGLVPVFKKIKKSVIFNFSVYFYTDTILKQWNILKNKIYFLFFFTFHFSLLFSVFCSRCASLSWSLVYDPVALPLRGVEVLEPTVEKLMS